MLRREEILDPEEADTLRLKIFSHQLLLVRIDAFDPFPYNDNIPLLSQCFADLDRVAHALTDAKVEREADHDNLFDLRICRQKLGVNAEGVKGVCRPPHHSVAGPEWNEPGRILCLAPPVAQRKPSMRRGRHQFPGEAGPGGGHSAELLSFRA